MRRRERGINTAEIWKAIVWCKYRVDQGGPFNYDFYDLPLPCSPGRNYESTTCHCQCIMDCYEISLRYQGIPYFLEAKEREPEHERECGRELVPNGLEYFFVLCIDPVKEMCHILRLRTESTALFHCLSSLLSKPVSLSVCTCRIRSTLFRVSGFPILCFPTGAE
jgi:hypothetical protein